MKTIVLTGMMGCGKTTTGQILAQKSGSGFIDLDMEIEKREQHSITDIFNTRGEKYFRALEKEILFDIFTGENQVIALGGGTFENPEIRKFLLKHSCVIYLETSAEIIEARIGKDNTRPLLSGGDAFEKIKNFIEKRKSNYETAHYKILTDNKSPEELSAEILGVLKND